MNLLQQIVERKRHEVARTRQSVPLEELERRLDPAPPPRDFAAAVQQNGLSLIAESKHASPSAGVICEDYDPVRITRTYQAAGAQCVSVLTDGPGFQGSLDDLRNVRAAIDLPVLRKDFILDRYQLVEARAAGADCALLIAECLEQTELETLNRQARELGLATLIEIYDESNLQRVLDVEPSLLGINNRNLRTFEVRIEHTLDLLPRIPSGVPVVSESGIRSSAEINTLREAGVSAVLIGETLMRANDPARKIRELFDH